MLLLLLLFKLLLLLIYLFIYLFIYWVWQTDAGLQRIHTDIHAVKKLGLYIEYNQQNARIWLLTASKQNLFYYENKLGIKQLLLTYCKVFII